ncbi:hypothetical protein U9M48_038020 [Paspalum notatum var. saurae]|uniref:Uncharacterized protein n=1 Tax=Paspalum notatum var. saurae TaxID=547442 RepID=A0AAQ3UHN9_PASNO
MPGDGALEIEQEISPPRADARPLPATVESLVPMLAPPLHRAQPSPASPLPMVIAQVKPPPSPERRERDLCLQWLHPHCIATVWLAQTRRAHGRLANGSAHPLPRPCRPLYAMVPTPCFCRRVPWQRSGWYKTTG